MALSGILQIVNSVFLRDGIVSILTSPLQCTHYSVRCEKSPTRRGKLRTASENCQYVVLVCLSFAPGLYSPCFIVNPEVRREIRR